MSKFFSKSISLLELTLINNSAPLALLGNFMRPFLSSALPEAKIFSALPSYWCYWPRSSIFSMVISWCMQSLRRDSETAKVSYSSSLNASNIPRIVGSTSLCMERFRRFRVSKLKFLT